MDRIKQALEKVRTGREAAPMRSVIAHPPRLVQRRDVPEKIVYRDTRVVRLNAQHLEANRVIALNKSDPRTMTFDLLRTQVVRTMRQNGWKTMAVVSPTTESGKTLVAINLSISIAHQPEHTVLLADFELRRPKVGQYLGLPNAGSLGDFLCGSATLSELLVNPGVPRLVILPNNEAVPNASEVLMGARMQELVHELRNRYPSRFVIFDLPPLLGTDDAIAFLPYVDCALLVVANGENTAVEVEESMRLLHSVPLLGTVLNKADVESRPYYARRRRVLGL